MNEDCWRREFKWQSAVRVHRYVELNGLNMVVRALMLKEDFMLARQLKFVGIFIQLSSYFLTRYFINNLFTLALRTGG